MKPAPHPLETVRVGRKSAELFLGGRSESDIDPGMKCVRRPGKLVGLSFSPVGEFVLGYAGQVVIKLWRGLRFWGDVRYLKPGE